MQMSGDYGTELLIRYREQELLADLERRRIVKERLAETRPAKSGSTIRARLTTLFGAHTAPAAPRLTGVSQVHAAHR